MVGIYHLANNQVVGMKLAVLFVMALTGGLVFFWPQLRVIMAEYEYTRPVVEVVDRATSSVPPLRGYQSHLELGGKVVTVADGDTFTMLTADKREIRVRLTEVDAPEGGQAWGRRAKQALTALIAAQTVRVVSEGEDQYGRTLGRVFVGQKDVNAELVRIGAAHAYREHLTDTSLIAIEDEAHAAKRGLWALAAAQTQRPWEWRQTNRRDEAGVSVAVSASPSVSTASSAAHCGSKRYCREMSSCSEAGFYVVACGVTRLDSDGNGIPCENLCRRKPRLRSRA